MGVGASWGRCIKKKVMDGWSRTTYRSPLSSAPGMSSLTTASPRSPGSGMAPASVCRTPMRPLSTPNTSGPLSSVSMVSGRAG